MTNQRAIYELAERQYGLVGRAELRDLGWTAKPVRRLITTGLLVPVGTKTFGIGGLAMSDHRRVMAACLDAGGVATRGTAAWLHGIGGFEPGRPPSVVVAKCGRDFRSPVADVHASTWLPSDDLVVVDGIPCLGVARTLFSLVAAVPDVELDVARDAIDVAVRDGKATDAWMWWMLERIRCRGRNGVRLFEEILVERDGGSVTESWLERRFLRLLAAAGVTLPRCQRRVERNGAFVARVDFAYDDLKIVIEVSGYTHHSTRRQQVADARRRNELALAGYMVVEFTYDDLVGDPAYVVGKLLEVVAQAHLARA